jgi:hypothetical protein
MTMSISGGSAGISADDMIQYLFSSSWSGVSTNPGEYRRHKQAYSDGDI